MARTVTFTVTDNDVVLDADGEPIAFGDTVPVGMGTVEVRRRRKDQRPTFVRYSGSGRFSHATVAHRPGRYRIGPSYGHRIVEPAEERDPIVRVLREAGISPRALTRHGAGENLDVTVNYADVRIMRTVEGASTEDVLTDGTLDEDVLDVDTREHPVWRGDTEVARATSTIRVAGATWALRVRYRTHMNGSIGAYVDEVHVWPGVDADALAAGIGNVPPYR